MAEKISKLGIKRDSDFMYFIKTGDVWRVARPPLDGTPVDVPSQPEMVERLGASMDHRYVYFLDSDGDVARAQRRSEGQKSKRPTKGGNATKKSPVS